MLTGNGYNLSELTHRFPGGRRIIPVQTMHANHAILAIAARRGS